MVNETDSPHAASTPRQPKSLIVFSDGTGNSSAKLFKTNVWRLYQAVDTAIPLNGQQRQIVAYDDGVGTSSFKPLALLGGVFGVGLMRNVLDLYRFICANYERGDRIYAFGFSRGAFTIRVLIGLLTTVGIIRGKTMTGRDLDVLSNDAYRRFRRCFVLSGNRSEESPRLQLTNLTVNPLRSLLDFGIRLLRRVTNTRTLRDEDKIEITDEIAFVGVWDTVAAYGFPIAEVTKGIDRWVWPLSMPDYKLSDRVRCARHALALDDERDTFHPLLWDEVHEAELVTKGSVAPDRLRQVWFAGMHSDVGGGYADDSLAYVSLVWMAEQAMAKGLRLLPKEIAEYRAKADPFGPIHDSRSGLAAYYRYQPRKISARLEPRDPTTRVFQDPDFEHGLLKRVHVHHSVLERIARGTDGYAPIVLPAAYDVEDGRTFEARADLRAKAQERVWDDVWQRRVNYFVTLALTGVLASMRFWPVPESSCVGPQCVITPVLRTVGDFLPGFAAAWVDAFADRPGVFVTLAVLIGWLLARTRKTEQTLRDRMRLLFAASMSTDQDAGGRLATAATLKGLIRPIRSSRLYQAALQYFKWQASPAVGAVVAYMAIGAVVYGAVSVVHRTQVAVSAEALCGASADAPSARFSTTDLCWRTGVEVVAGARYELRLDVTEPWSDGGTDYPTSPEGFSTHRFPWWLRVPAALLRRSISDPWFRPIVQVQSYRFGRTPLVSVEMRRRDGNAYVGEFTAPADGEVALFVNDAVFLWSGPTSYFYDNNLGSADVSITRCNEDATGQCDLQPRAAAR